MTAAAEAAPLTLPVCAENIPGALKSRRQWVCWYWKRNGDKWTKPLLNPRTGRGASHSDPNDWGTIDEALAYAGRHGLPGIGYVFSIDDPYTGIDLDKCRNAATGEIQPWAAEIIENIDSYSELSPTATGVHIIPEAVLSVASGRKKGPIEMYHASRFFTMTGHRIPDTPATIRRRQQQVDTLWTATFGPTESADPPPSSNGHRPTGGLTDGDVIRRASEARNGDKFRRLFYDGDTADYGGDDSKADDALCVILAFWTGGDKAQIERLFSRSAFGQRDKWKNRADYRKSTIDDAVGKQKEHYAPPPGQGAASADENGSTNAGDEDLSWSERRPLPPPNPAPTLPDQMIPEPLRPWLTDIATSASVPFAMVMPSAIVALGSVIGRTVGIKPYRFNDFITVPNVWGIVVAPPAWLKSFAVSEPLSPIRRLAAMAHERYEEEKEAAATIVAILSAQIKAIESQMTDLAKKGADPSSLKERHREKRAELKAAIPVERRYLSHDATVEKWGELLRDNPHGMLEVRDELYGLLRSFEKSGREADRQFYLEAWAGTGSFTTDRIGRGTVHIPNLCLSIIGGIQPGRLRSLIEGATGGGSEDDGLLQRFQLAVWPDELPPWRKPVRWPDSAARDGAFAIFERLDQLSPLKIKAVRDREGSIPYLTFSTLAQMLADRWRDELERRIHSDEFNDSPAFAAHLGKFRSLMPSLALIFHLVDVAAGLKTGDAIGEAPTRLALAWTEFLEAHARKIYDVELDKGMAAARALAAKLEEGALVDGEIVRDIYRHHWTGLATDVAVFNGLKVLTGLGWVRLVTVPTGGRTSQIVRIHPDLRKASNHG